MKTTARNELNGSIVQIKHGQVISEVEMSISPEISILATITNDATKSLDLKVGEDVSAIIKSSHVLLSKEELRTTARNNFLTTIKEIIPGAVNCEVKLSVGEQTLCAIITNDSCKELGLKTDDEVYAFFKASSVILFA